MSHSHSDVPLLLPVGVTALGLLCLYKLYKVCSVKVVPGCVTVVYDTRRKTVLCTSIDKQMKRAYSPPINHFSPLLYFSSLFVYSTGDTVVSPPSPFFGTFTLPKSVFRPDECEALNFTLENVPTMDGVALIIFTIRYTIPFDQLDRYLAAVGPRPPNEVIGVAAAAVARMHCGEVSIGILLNKARRDSVFMKGFTEHLRTKLMSESAVQLQRVTVENVELQDSN